MNINRVLLTGGRAPATLELARLFSQQGSQVHVADSFPYALCKVSKAIKAFHDVPAAKQQPQAFIDELVKIVAAEQIDLLIPTCEEIFTIAHFQDSFPASCTLLTERADRLLRAHHKFEFIEWAKRLGLLIPETYYIDTKEQWYNMLNRLPANENYIAKPVYTRSSNELIYLPMDREKPIDYKKGWVIQRLLQGDQYCTYSLTRNGEVTAHTTYKSEFRVGAGTTISFQHEQHEEIEQWVRGFVRKTNWTGQIAFDFIRHSDGRCYPIECNPRLTSGIHLFRHTALVEKFVTDSGGIMTPTSNRRVSLIGAMCIFAGQQVKQHGLRKYIQALGDSEDAVFHRQDWRPFMYQLNASYQFAKIAKRQRISVLEATTADIAWDGERQ